VILEFDLWCVGKLIFSHMLLQFLHKRQNVLLHRIFAVFDVGSTARELLLRRARQAETASHISEWLSSPELQSPKRA
jgi:hypothetical protein